ncbi:ROK family protein [Sunxiuqinia sp. A32]|uniref:ROK family protein n=1 Tax=Sunxiuqinia sp. A32 TaxID=3461496 RepID=UPI004045FFBE
MKKKYAIGVDVGGSHISVLSMDMEKETILKNGKSCCVVDNTASAIEILNSWKDALGKSISDIGQNDLVGIGIAMPGPFDYTNGVALFTKDVNKFENLYGVNVAVELKKVLDLPDNVPIRFVNDATAFAIGDAWKGKSSNSKRTIAITLGTGLGVAFIESGIPVLERNDVPPKGCLYHLPYKDSIANDYFCTGWFVNEYAKRTGKSAHGVKEIARQTDANPELIEIFNEFGASLAEFLSLWIQRFNADCLVLGGNIARAFELFGPAFSSVLERRSIDIKIQLSNQMESSAMMGSARLMNEDFWKQIQPLLPLM